MWMNQIRPPDFDSLVPRPKRWRPVAIIGAGGIVRDAHLPAYRKARIPVEGITDLIPDKAAALAAQFDFARVAPSIEALVNDASGETVFDVAVPASVQTGVLRQLPEGAAVLLQKPMGETLAQAQEILALCRKKRFVAAVNFQLRFAPNMLAARWLADCGLIGEVHDLEVRVRAVVPWGMWEFLSNAPRVEILYHSVHYIDLARSWFGNPRGVYAKTVVNPRVPTMAATKSAIVLDYGERKRVLISTNHSHDFSPEMQESYVQWEGTLGSIQAQMGVLLNYPSGADDTLRYVTRDASIWRDIPLSGRWFPDAFVGTMGSLQAFLEGTLPTLPTSVEDAIDTMRTVEAAYISSLQGGTLLP
jgi:predicted dehydrogenase